MIDLLEQEEFCGEPPSLRELGLERLGIADGILKVDLRDPESGAEYTVSSLLIEPREMKAGRDKYVTIGLWENKNGEELPVGQVSFCLPTAAKLATCDRSSFFLMKDSVPLPDRFDRLRQALKTAYGKDDARA
ncbi:MAG TPA: hypothetical protein VMW41_02160 [Candidatus Bathyarchaeia archaeon]|nr:hypothetical protein [Candidatus Bathyarchaeia archaeon]